MERGGGLAALDAVGEGSVEGDCGSALGEGYLVVASLEDTEEASAAGDFKVLSVVVCITYYV